MKFRKKPIVVEAYQLTEEKEIHTREGTLRGYPGDWIITGIQGEIYPCGKEIFEQTYEPADSNPTPAADEYHGNCLNGTAKCPPQCMTSSGCPHLNLQDFDGEPETYPQDSFCNCPHRKKQHDAAIREEAYESEYVKALVGNAFRAGEMKGAKDEREKVLKAFEIEWNPFKQSMKDFIESLLRREVQEI